jgi:hypothetical protein
MNESEDKKKYWMISSTPRNLINREKRFWRQKYAFAVI